MRDHGDERVRAEKLEFPAEEIADPGLRSPELSGGLRPVSDLRTLRIPVATGCARLGEACYDCDAIGRAWGVGDVDR